MNTLWPPADGTSTYVRRLRRPGWLIYHRADCRHVQDRPDVVPVDMDEVRRVLEIAPTYVEFEGRKVYLYPCRMCLHRDSLRRWPEGSQNGSGPSANYTGPGRYRHYKGGDYLVIGLAIVEATFEEGTEDHVTEVVYKPVSLGTVLDTRAETFWTRPLDDFNAQVEIREFEGHSVLPRFTRIQ